MSTEAALHEVLSHAGEKGERFLNQINRFRAFREEMERAGYSIPQETFSIPLMERVAPCIHPDC